MKANRTTLSLALLTLLPACAPAPREAAPAPAPAGTPAASSRSGEVQRFLDEYLGAYQRLYYEAQQAEWASNTRIVEGDTTNAARTRRAQEALTAFTGSTANIQRVRGFLQDRDGLDPLQVRQLEKILYTAAAPQTAAELVKARIAAEAQQTERLYGYQFTLNGSGPGDARAPSGAHPSRNCPQPRPLPPPVGEG